MTYLQGETWILTVAGRHRIRIAEFKCLSNASFFTLKSHRLVGRRRIQPSNLAQPSTAIHDPLGIIPLERMSRFTVCTYQSSLASFLS